MAHTVRVAAAVVGALLTVVAPPAPARAFYIPGLAPVEFETGAPVHVQAIKMTSSLTQLPYDYYHLAFCPPVNHQLVYQSESLGEVLRGDRIVNTPYQLFMNTNVMCRPVCGSPETPLQWSPQQTNTAIQLIKDDYSVHLLVDNLPCATPFNFTATDSAIRRRLSVGHRLGGVTDQGRVYINNHLQLVIRYHSIDNVRHRVVGFEVLPSSVARQSVSGSSSVCQMDQHFDLMYLAQDKATSILFSYGVSWVPSDIRWASRWDAYLTTDDTKVHWLSLLNSYILIIIPSVVVTMIIVGILRRDIARYNKSTSTDHDSAAAALLPDTDPDTLLLEDTGWKLVHGDVFRAPARATLLAIVTGSGVQLFFMALLVIFFAMLGMLSPASRGSLLTVAITLYNFMGLVAGYLSSRIYKTLRGRRWKRTAFWTAVLYPAVVSCVVIFINFFMVYKESSRSIPFTAMLSVLAMWFGISVPLVYVGSYFGFSRPPVQHPVRTNQIPRQVPDQPCYGGTLISVLLAGVFPFAIVLYDLFLIFSAIWLNQFYYMFGFLFLVFFAFIVACCQMSVMFTYLQLCCEDYHWWWRSFLLSSSSTVYVALYSIYYFLTRLEIVGFVPTLVYFGYSLLMLFTYWLITGSVGFLATYYFISLIYGAIKIE